jgi:hypothetical protein
MTFTTKNPSGNVETRKSAVGNDAKDKSSAKLVDGGRGRDTAMRKDHDTGLTAVEFARQFGGECKAKRGPFKSGGIH